MVQQKHGLSPGSPVIVYLHTPKEKIWGLVLDLKASGVFLLGIDLNTFDEWCRMIVRGERNIGPTQVFLPMWRVERITADQSVDEIPSMADQFFQRVGISVTDYLNSSNEPVS